MSLDAYNRSLLSTNIHFKNFVKETEHASSNSREFNDKRKLNFDGDEARLAYEEIVNNGDDVKKTKSSRNGERRKKIANHEKERYDSRRVRESRKHVARVTANSVLKAVETGDVEFLEHNLTTQNVNISDDYGWTPLMSASFCGNYKIVEFLLKLGADTRCRDKSGFTAGGLASKKNHSGIVALLKEKQTLLDSETTSSRNHSSKKDSNRLSEKKQFYCSVCQESFKETSVRKHEASTLHIFNTKPKLPGTVYTIPKQNKGYQMLLKKGWEEEGLGPNGEGPKYPVKTVLKRDRRGLDETRKDKARVTHFGAGDSRAVASFKREANERTLRKRDRERILSREARRERALRRALS